MDKWKLEDSIRLMVRLKTVMSVRKVYITQSTLYLTQLELDPVIMKNLLLCYRESKHPGSDTFYTYIHT